MTQADMRVHWDRRWAGTEAEQVSWYQSRATTSLRLITEHCPPSQPVVDVGAARSTLAISLIERGYRDVTVLDVSERALGDTTDTTRGGPHRVVSDLLSWRAGRRYAAWHDRAVFHFLTEPDEQSQYRDIAADTIRPGGFLVLATFAPDGPKPAPVYPCTDGTRRV